MCEVSPTALIIAGPNGAGKTTFAREYLVHEAVCLSFVNADMIAAGLSPFAPEEAAMQASRLMVSEVNRHVARRESFAVETTLAAIGYIRKIRHWRNGGFHVKLIFLWLPSEELALERVALRVVQGGHSIPEDVIRRRYRAGLVNFDLYKTLVDHWQVYDNSGARPALMDEGDNT